MSWHALLLFVCLAAPALAAPKAPTHAAVRKAVEHNRAALVHVTGPKGSGPGVVVGQRGEVLTSVQYVSLYDARVKAGDADLSARVIAANAALRIAVVGVEGDRALKASPVRLLQKFEPGMWLVGLRRDRKGVVRPALGQVKRARKGFVETSVYLRSGSPLYDAQGRLVALCVQWRKQGCVALPIPAVKNELVAAGSGTP